MKFQTQLRPSILYFRGVIALMFAAFCLLALRSETLFFSVITSAFLIADGGISLFLRDPENEIPLFAWCTLSALISFLAGG